MSILSLQWEDTHKAVVLGKGLENTADGVRSQEAIYELLSGKATFSGGKEG